MPKILVISYLRNGKLPATCSEMLGGVRPMIQKAAARLEVALIGSPDHHARQSIQELAGVAPVLTVEHELLASGHPDAFLKATEQVVQHCDPELLMMAHDEIGREVGPRLAHRLSAGLVTDCLAMDFENDWVFCRPVYGGKAMAKVSIETALKLATVRSKAFPSAAQEELAGAPAHEIRSLAIELGEKDLGYEVVDTEERSSEFDLASAPVVVSGGRGLGGPEPFRLLEEIAGLLNGAVGASRAAVDAGWIDPSHQVGQTGTMVAPDLYIAVGISGASQHLAGMSGSKKVVAVNKDVNAPIFQVADVGVVAEFEDVLPAFLEECRRRLRDLPA